MSKIWLVAVTAGRWQAQTIIKAKQLGYNIVAIDADKHAEGFAYADLNIVASLEDFKAIITQLEHLPIVGVLSICSDAGMLLAGKIREYFKSTTGPSLSVSSCLTNKKRQRICWQQAQVNGPTWFASKNITSLINYVKKITPPFIIKPTDSAGSRGVFKVESYQQPIKKYLQEAQTFSRTNEVIIEDYMDGDEYTVETFIEKGVVNVLAITEKKKIAAAKGLVAYELATTTQPLAIQQKITHLVKKAYQSVNYQNGAGHAEVIVMRNGDVGMVEIAGRGGGFLVFEKFVHYASGYDIVSNVIKQAMGEQPSPVHLKPQHTILHFFPNIAGTVTKILGFEDANQLVGIEAASFVKVGDKLNAACSDGDRMGYFISYASTPEKAIVQAEQAKKLITYKVI